jgi:hypothetical protein
VRLLCAQKNMRATRRAVCIVAALGWLAGMKRLFSSAGELGKGMGRQASYELF